MGGPEDTAKISPECLDRLRRSVSKSLGVCNDCGSFKSLSLEEFTNIVSSGSSKSLYQISSGSSQWKKLVLYLSRMKVRYSYTHLFIYILLLNDGKSLKKYCLMFIHYSYVKVLKKT